MQRITPYLFIPLFVFFFAACAAQTDDVSLSENYLESYDTTTSTQPTENTTGEAPMQQDAQNQPENMAPEEVTELMGQDTTVGTGATAEAGDSVTVHYVGTLLDGTKFDSSRDRGTPFTFDLGAGMVIQGWDVGVAGMKEGGTRVLLIPADMAYGERGVPGAIPPNAPLRFEVELLEVTKAQ